MSNFGSRIQASPGRTAIPGADLKSAKDHVLVIIDAGLVCGGKFEGQEDAWKLFNVISQFAAHELPMQVRFPEKSKIRLEFMHSLCHSVNKVGESIAWVNLFNRSTGELIPEWNK